MPDRGVIRGTHQGCGLLTPVPMGLRWQERAAGPGSYLCCVCRGGGLGLVLASAGFGRLTAPIMELHNQKGYFLHHVIFACCTLICIICILLLPESKNQNLPENIPDGEHYTRQPLLPHKKGEQPLLLTNSELKDYSGLHDSAAVSDGISENTTANGMKSM